MTGETVDLLDYIFDTYSISDTVDFVFDSSNPSFTTLNTTRAFSLLRRELAWVMTLKALIKGDTEDLEAFLQKVATLDPNACQWLLERLHETFEAKEEYTKLLAGLYASIIVGKLPLEVKIPAISNLASYLQVALETKDAALIPALAWEDLAAQVKIGSTSKGFNRDRADADLQLEGCLIGLKSITRDHEILETEVREWATRLRFALAEETVCACSQLDNQSLLTRLRNFPPATPQQHPSPRLREHIVLQDNPHESNKLFWRYTSFYMTCSMMTTKNYGTLPPQPPHTFSRTPPPRLRRQWLCPP
jgi:hypothetical protein